MLSLLLSHGMLRTFDKSTERHACVREGCHYEIDGILVASLFELGGLEHRESDRPSTSV